MTRLSAEQEKVPALGQVITAKYLGHALNQQLQQLDNLTLFCPRTVSAVVTEAEHVKVTLDNHDTLTAKLLVAADGRESTIRHCLNLSAWEHDYSQVAIPDNSSTDKPNHGWAYERFTTSVTMALFPMNDKPISLVRTCTAG